MPGFSIEKNGFLDLDSLLTDFVDTLTNFGTTPAYTAVSGGATFKPLNQVKAGPGVIVLESTSEFLLGGTQPWRLAFNIDSGMVVNVGTPLQIDDTGYIANSSWLTSLKCGQLNDDDPTKPKLISYEDWGINTLLDIKPGTTPAPGTTNWPLSYRLTVTDRGLIVFIWGEALTVDWKPTISWFAIQRPVHPDTGAPLIKGKCPLFCIYSQSGGDVSITNPDLYPEHGIRQIIIREIDINVPRRGFSAVYHTDMGNAVINPTKQISFTEDKEYLVTFPNGLVTSRYAYIHEYDMMAYTSADVIPAWVVAEITMYGEATPRKYVAMPANGMHESYMRLLILMDGGGVKYSSPAQSNYVGTI